VGSLFMSPIHPLNRVGLPTSLSRRLATFVFDEEWFLSG